LGRDVTVDLDGMSKEEVADMASMLFAFQLLGPTVLLELAEKYPWLVERAPKRWEMEATLDLARRGKTIDKADDEYFALCGKLRKKYSFENQVELWEKGEPCFPLVVSGALREVLAAAIGQLHGVPESTVWRWARGSSKPHPKVQEQVVAELRTLIQRTRDEHYGEDHDAEHDRSDE
jgi:hypothetical protein